MTTVTLLPESDEQTLCVSLHGWVTLHDYKTFFDDEVRKRIHTQGFVKLLIMYDADFEGWKEDAAEMNFRSICELAPKTRRTAYINPGEAKIMMMKLAQPIVGGEMRFFTLEELPDALKWIKEDL